MIRPHLAVCDSIADLLDAVIRVDEVKVFKPNPRVYELAAMHLETPKSSIGFVSSNNWDVNGAGSAGLTTSGVSVPQRNHPKNWVTPPCTSCIS